MREPLACTTSVSNHTSLLSLLLRCLRFSNDATAVSESVVWPYKLHACHMHATPPHGARQHNSRSQYTIQTCVTGGSLDCCGVCPCKRREAPPGLFNPGGIVLSDIQQIVPRNLDYHYLRVPSCRAPGPTPEGG